METSSIKSREELDEFVFVGENNSTLDEINEMRIKNELTDVVIQIGSRQFSAHRNILSANVEFFKVMFLSEFKEASEKIVVISDQNVDPEVFEDILEYIYLRKLRITNFNCQSIYVAAHYMNYVSLKNVTEQYLCGRITSENFFDLLQFGETFKLESLNRELEKFQFNNMKAIHSTHEFLTQNFKHIEMLSTVAKNQEELFKAFVKWVSHNADARLKHLPSLLQSIPLHSLSSNFLLKEVAATALISQCFKSLKLYFEATNFGRSELMFCLGGIGKNKAAMNSMISWNPKSNSWTNEAPMAVPRYHCSSVVMENKIYIVGGCDGSSVFKTLNVYDITTKVWANVPSMMNARMNCGIAAHNGHVYVCGGKDMTSNLSSFERFDPSTKTWTVLASMEHPRHSLELVAFSGKLYAIGGFYETNWLRTVEQYDPVNNSWQLYSPPINEQDNNALKNLAPTSNTSSGKILVCCGDKLEEYDISNNVWKFVAQIPNSYHGKKVVIVNGRIYLMGRIELNTLDSPHETLTTIYEFNSATKQWKIIGDMNVPCEAFSVAIVKARLSRKPSQ